MIERLLSWGGGHGQAGYSPASPERLAEGPSAVAVGPAGEVVLLDRLNDRVLRIAGGQISAAASVPRDAEDLAVGPEAWFSGPSGTQVDRNA